MDSSLVLLFGRARALVLSALYHAADSGMALHLREVARRTGLSPTAVQYELRLLRQLDLIKDIGAETRPAYVLNEEHIFFDDLRSLFTRTHARVLADDPHFAQKRTRQRQDRVQSSAANSAFLQRRKS